jgi:DNA-binding FrmR family transcriptional regulator
MAHTVLHQKRLLARVRRIGGQVAGIEKALERQDDCYRILQTITACRGAMNSLMSELIEGHVLHHILDPKRPPTAQQRAAAKELMAVVKSYLK